MLNLQLSKQFKKDYKKIQKQGKKINELWAIIEKLLKNEKLAPKFKDHQLIGNYKNHRGCHINPDWLLIYKIDSDKLILTAVRTGSHSDLY
ncbi:MAG: type II toxin-antitoxin system YafQ family toxin [Chitinispirillales bacterium]|jgi:mRNA interferase YafQ|nr:type II toxin-antitoxin system YafQ family toxin [Chitinispirillales bacterium]